MKISKKLTTIASLTALGLYVAPASAELFINPSNNSGQGRVEASGFYGTSTIEFDPDAKAGYDTSKADLDRTFIGITGAYGISDTLDVYGTFANIMKAEAEDVNDDGSGTAYAIGLRGAIPFNGNIHLSGYVQYLSIEEDYGSERGFVDVYIPGVGTFFDVSGKLEYEGKLKELSGGVVASMQASNEVTLYGGLELVAMSDAELKMKRSATIQGVAVGDEITFDGERADKIGFRLGAQYNAEAAGFFLSTVFGHETGFMLGVNKTF